MKVQCDVCEKAEAEVLCCADEAVLCVECDERVHGANMLSQKHERLCLLKCPLPSSSSSAVSSSSALPLCDKCQEKNGYVFCLEERALLCRHCDMSKHMSGSPYTSSHQRLLIADIKVSLQPSTNNSDNIGYNSTNYPASLSMSSTMNKFPADNESRTMDVEAAYAENTATFLGGSGFPTECNWTLDEILDTNSFNYYEFSDAGSSRIGSQ
ncbi:B-box zinc finger protein 23 [Ziziphus jujuba]|uniref:B-box zinc finger protein 23 n=1 Tax=Ziziphus jujuba TaxID=326968 RepID=A0A6P4A7H0_ZIZJJ|nr:B-box zinc finger protein 23 [Ziziphus jujuba]